MVVKNSERTNRINTFIYKFERETENKPSKEEMLEGLKWIYSVAKDTIGKGEQDRKRFIKRIEQNFE